MNEANQVIDRLFEVFRAKNNNELANFLGIAYNTISTWRNRNTIPYHICVDVAKRKKISLDWLLLGRGQMYWKDYSPVLDSPTNTIQEPRPVPYLTEDKTVTALLLKNMDRLFHELSELKQRIDRLEKG